MIDIREGRSGVRKVVYRGVSVFGLLAEPERAGDRRETSDSVVLLVADEDGQIVDHVMLSRMDAPFPALGVAPVSNIPGRQGSGVR